MSIRKAKNILFIVMMSFVIASWITREDLYQIIAGIIAVPTLILIGVEYRKKLKR